MFETAEIKKRLAKKELADPIVERFTRYVKFETTSCEENAKEKPSTKTQLELCNALLQELNDMGFTTSIDQYGFVIGDLPATKGYENKESVLLIAHVDTSEQCSGKNVKPCIHENYDGGVLEIGNGVSIDTKNTPNLKNCYGDTINTSDGTTLLGSDDKAGIANIMTAVDYVIKNNIEHGPLQVMFNTDEEIGNGMENVPLQKLHSKVSLTVDSTNAPLVESQCFNAYLATIVFRGFSVHPGYARGKLVNASNMAAQFVTMLPRNESPEATDNAYGYFYVDSIKSSVEEATVSVLIRDFDRDGVQERRKRLEAIAKSVEAIFPGGSVEYKDHKQYQNMLYGMSQDSKVLGLVRKATLDTIGIIDEALIRGGTDGSMLTEMGIPTPNIFTGGENPHSRSEYAVLSQMVASTEILINLIKLVAHDE